MFKIAEKRKKNREGSENMVKETVDPRKPKPGETRAEYQERRKKEIEKAKKPLTYAQQRLWQKRDMRQKAKYTPFF